MLAFFVVFGVALFMFKLGIWPGTIYHATSENIVHSVELLWYSILFIN